MRAKVGRWRLSVGGTIPGWDSRSAAAATAQMQMQRTRPLWTSARRYLYRRPRMVATPPLKTGSIRPSR